MFRRQKVSKKLSADELKSKLYAHFDKSGSLNQLRTQLRSQLVSELFKIAPPPAINESSDSAAPNFDKTLLPLQVCHWLINDHLFRQGFQYTLSTFVSETNMPYLEKLLTAGDILGLFGLDNSTQEYKKISEMYVDKDAKGCLNSLLLAIIKSLFDLSNKDNEKEEKQKSEIRPESEIAISSYINSSNHERAISAKKYDLEQTSSRSYYNNMPETHKPNLQEQIQFIKEEKNREIKNLRHKLLEELERLHSQERCMQQELEQEKKEIRKDRDILVSEKELLKEKETLFIKEQENKYEKKAREIEEGYVAKLHSKDKELDFLCKKIEDREKKLGQTEFDLSSHQERCESLKRELNDVNQMYKSIHEKYNSLLDENTNLVRKFENMSDYNIIKEELSLKSKEIINLQQEIEKARNNAEKDRRAYVETVTSLELKLKSTEPRLHQLQRELNQTRDTLHMEEAMWNNEKTKLEKESSTSKELYKTVLQRIEEQKQDIHDLHQTIHILHYQLTSKDTSYTVKSEPPLFVKTIPKAASFSANDTIDKSYKNNPIYLSQKYRENALNFTSDYKNRLRKLQEEIDASYDKYSLIYCSSHDDKILTSKSLSKNNTSLFGYKAKLNDPLLSKNLASKSSDLFSGFSKPLMSSFKKFVPSMNSNKKDIVTGMFNKKIGKSLLQNSDTPTHSFLNQTKSHSSDYISGENTLKFKSSSYPFSLHSLEENKLFQVTNKDNMLSLPKISLEFQDNQITQNKNETDKTLLNKTYEKSSPHISTKTYIPDSNSETENKSTNFSSNFMNADAINVSSLTRKSEFSIVNSAAYENQSMQSNAESSQEKWNEMSPLNSDINEKLVKKPYDSQAVVSAEAEQSSVAVNSRNNLKDLIKPLGNTITETTPIVVDLDAAWKRKTSLPSVSLPVFQNSSLFIHDNENKDIPHKEKDAYSKLLVPMAKTNRNGKSKNTESSISHILEEKPTSSVPLTTNTLIIVETNVHTKDLLHPLEGITENKLLSDDRNAIDNEAKRYLDGDVKRSIDDISKDAESSILQIHEEKTSSASLTTITPISVETNIHTKDSLHPLESITENRLLSDDMSATDNEAKRYHNSDIKHVVDDSLSELSEVHLSCGSGQEEHKEESDNW